MDGNGIRNYRDFGLLEPSNNALHYKGYNFDLQLMSSMAENPFYGGSGIHSRHETDSPSVMPSHHHRVGGVPTSMDFWLNHNREKYLINGLSGSNQHGYYQPNNGVSPETSSNHSIQMSQQITLPKTENVIPHMGGSCEERDNVSSGSGCVLPKKRAGGKLPKSPPKEKKARTRAPRTPKDITSPSAHRSRVPKKRAEIVINGINMDISGIPIPICSCTGTPQQCYRWGSGGWQSACCTTGMSVYPLPMSTKRRGARIAGRKMSIGAFKKVLEKLASEGYNFSNPIDLRSFWAKHGTNKFVTIR